MMIAHSHRQKVLSLLLLLGGMISGLYCNPLRVDLAAMPKAETQPGGSLQLIVSLTRPQANLVFRWRAVHGKCEPSQSSQLTTIYTAAPKVTADDPTEDTVTVEVLRGDRVVRTQKLSIKILKGPVNIPPPTVANSNESSPVGATQTASPKPERPTGGPTVVSSKPAIHITRIPRYDPTGGDASRDEIAGETIGINPSECRIVIYALTNHWYIQPYVDAPFTNVNSDGHWTAITHGGIQYAALLVKPDFKPEPIADGLPTIGGAVLAISTVRGRE